MSETDLEYRQIDWACSAQNKELLPDSLKKTGQSLKQMGMARKVQIQRMQNGNKRTD